MRDLVDTDRIIDAIAGVIAAQRLLETLGRDGLGVSLVTLGELYEGAFLFPDPGVRMQTFRRFLDG